MEKGGKQYASDDGHFHHKRAPQETGESSSNGQARQVLAERSTNSRAAKAMESDKQTPGSNTQPTLNLLESTPNQNE